MATTADADLILKLYDIRREATMRKARAYAAFEFAPKTTEELLKVQRGAGTQENAYWRQAITFWEMAASFVLRGAVDADLFLDSSHEGIFIYTKYHRLYKEATGADFMPLTAQLVAKYPVAEQRHQAMHKRLNAQAESPVVKADEAFNKG